MKCLLISVVAVTFLGASGTALAASPLGETSPPGISKQLERAYSLVRSDQDGFLKVQNQHGRHRYDDRGHRPYQKYRHGWSRQPGYSFGNYKQKHYGQKKYGYGKRWHYKHQYRGHPELGRGHRQGYSRYHYYDKYHNDLSIRLQFGSGGLIHYRSR